MEIGVIEEASVVAPQGTQRRRAIAAALYFVCAGIALIHPVFGLVGDFVHPRVAGLPFSLVYILGWIVANTAVLAWMYRARVIDASEPPSEPHSQVATEREVGPHA